MAAPEAPSLQDVKVPQTPTRSLNPQDANLYAVALYQVILVNALVTRQHRAVLIDLSALIVSDMPALAALAQAISNPPTQAEVQAIQAKVNELVARSNLIVQRLTALKTSAGGNIKPVPLPT